MTKTLHILTQGDDPLARDVIAAQKLRADCKVETVDLAGREPDYAELLQRIFAADSVAVW